MRPRRLLTSDDDAIREVWPAFTDVMSTLALILFVLVLLAYVRTLTKDKALDALGLRIARSEARLQAAEADLARTTAEVASSRAALQASGDRLRAQSAVLADNDRELGDLRAQLQSIAVLRVDVLTKLKAAIDAQLGPGDGGASLVTLGDDGDVLINESLVFDSGSAALRPQAKPLLEGLARALGNLMADDAVRQNVESVVIQGHTDERGSAAYNWDLSAKRATAVLDALFEANPVLADRYGRYFAASAYSKYRPVDPTSTPAALQRNRRIEIAVTPRDANVRKVIDDYLRDRPDAGTSAAPAP